MKKRELKRYAKEDAYIVLTYLWLKYNVDISSYSKLIELYNSLECEDKHILEEVLESLSPGALKNVIKQFTK